MARRCRHWGLITGSAFKSTSNGHIDRKVSTDHENWSETSFQVSLGFTIYAKGDLFITSHVLQIDSLAIWQDISLSVAWRFLHIDPETFYWRHTLQKMSKKSPSSPKWDWRAGVGHPAWKQDPSPAYRAASVRFYERAFIFLRTDFPGRFWKTSGTKREGKENWGSLLQYREHCFSGCLFLHLLRLTFCFPPLPFFPPLPPLAWATLARKLETSLKLSLVFHFFPLFLPPKPNFWSLYFLLALALSK